MPISREWTKRIWNRVARSGAVKIKEMEWNSQYVEIPRTGGLTEEGELQNNVR